MSKLLPEPFTQFLDSLSFDQARNALLLVEISPDTLAVTVTGKRFTKPAVTLFQDRPTQVTLAGFRKKLLEILRSANHVATEPLADAILGCAVGAASSGEDRAAFLEGVLTQFRNAEVSHFFVLPNAAVTKPVRFDGYSLGELDLAVLESRCRRAQSDYCQLYAERLRGRFTVQSPDFKQVVIDFLKIGYDTGLFARSQTWRELLLNYFNLLSGQHFEYMWAHLDRSQVLSAPFYASFLDVQNLQRELGRFAERVTIYLGFSRAPAGYVVPQGESLNLYQSGPDSQSFARFLDHRKTYCLSEVGDSELGRTILACAGFCQQAIRFLESGRGDDAALYATICLEHLFSEKQSAVDSVSTRTAVLTHLRLSSSYLVALKELRKLYDARSAFVHAGKSVSATQAERLIAYARETLRSLLLLHLKPENRVPGFVEKWVKELDFIIAGVDAGKKFDDAFLASTGIFRP